MPHHTHEAGGRGTNAYKKLKKTKGDHVGYGDTDCRIILKWIRKSGSGDVTGLNSLDLRASLVTFLYM
jgi:hypothetical protein